MILSMIGLVGSLLLLIYLALRGMNLFVAAPLCALLIALTGNVVILDTEGTDNFIRGYMDGFSKFIGTWFFMFLLGSLFGKLMEHTGAAASLAHWIINKLGPKHAALSIVAVCAVLTYGGISVFIVAFSVYPMAVSLFRDANIPHYFIPAALAFGSGTFTMTSAGSPEIQNWIPIKYLGTTPYAAWEVSLVVAVFMAVSGFIWFKWMIKRAQARGDGFGRDEEITPDTQEQKTSSSDVSKSPLAPNPSADHPHPLTALVPLLMVFGTTFFTHKSLQENALVVALLAGCLTLAIINYRFITSASKIMADGTYGALLAIGNTSAIVGFGTVAKLSPAFTSIVAAVTSMEGSSLISAAIAVTIVAGLTGSASGGQTIVLPEIGPHFLDSGMDPEQLHRIVALSSGGLDSLPHSGYVVTSIRVICNETYKAAYLPMAALTIGIPGLGLVLAIILMNLGL